MNVQGGWVLQVEIVQGLVPNHETGIVRATSSRRLAVGDKRVKPDVALVGEQTTTVFDGWARILHTPRRARDTYTILADSSLAR